MQQQKFMEICLNVAKMHDGRTGLNPSVGALLLQGDVAITGVTGFGGIPHAEVCVIEKAKRCGISTSGATLFCTLEPCSHFGKTPPCVEAIIEAKITTVVFAVKDPDPRVNGEGVKKLQQNGIEVIHLYTEKVEAFYHPYFVFKGMGRPYICLKIASSLDGKIATQNGVSKWITNQYARNYTNFLRSRFDGIIVGANTIREDSPHLNCRIPGLEEFSPKKFVASKNPVEGYINVFGSVCEIATQIHQNGVQRLLVEGGADIITQFIEDNLYDELHVIQSGIFIGNDAKPAVNGLNLHSLPLKSMHLKECKEFDGNVLMVYRR